MKALQRALAFASITAWSACAFAGAVVVRYIDPSNFVDAGTSASDRKNNLDMLARYLQSLGRLLPANQTLRIDILDVDLAGEVHEPVHNGPRIRTLEGRADWPRISLRYTLEAGGKPLRSDEESVSDLDYANGNPNSDHESQPLFYEKRMLERWFRERFTDDSQAPSQSR